MKSKNVMGGPIIKPKTTGIGKMSLMLANFTPKIFSGKLKRMMKRITRLI